jgi:hypothetical protein
MMTKRIPYDQTAPDGLQIMMKMEASQKRPILTGLQES